MEKTTLIDSNDNKILFEYSWTGHLTITGLTHNSFTFIPEEVEKLKKLLNSFQDGNN